MLFKLSNLNSNLALTQGYLNPDLNNSVLGQFEYKHLFIGKPVFMTVPSTGILGLGLKLYPGNMQRMLNKDLT